MSWRTIHRVARLTGDEAEQIVAREPRERVCHDAFVSQRGRYRAAP
jgi:hypothetical protein